MATDEEIMQLWNSFPKKTKASAQEIIKFYRLAEAEGEKAGRQAGIEAVGKELVSDATSEQPRAKAYSERGSEICAENPRNRGFIAGIMETPRVAPGNFGSLLARLKSRGFRDP